MYIALAAIVSSLVIFSSGFYFGKITGQGKSNIEVTSLVKEIKKQKASENMSGKEGQPFLDRNSQPDTNINNSPSSSKEPIGSIVKAIPRAIVAPLYEQELFAEVESSSNYEELNSTRQNMLESEVKLLESTLEAMVSSGEPDDLIEHLRQDLSNLREGASLVEATTLGMGDNFTHEVTVEAGREELYQSLINDGVSLEDSERMANDVFSGKGDQNIIPSEPKDPPPPIEQAS